MKKETRYEMLGHIDQKYLDEAYPKKHNLASILIPVAACACLMALLVPTVITTLRPETASEGVNSADEVVLDADEAVLQQDSQDSLPPQTSAEPSVEAEEPPTSQEPTEPTIEPITLTPIVIEDPERDAYLWSYNSLLLANEGSLVTDPCYAQPPETEDVIFTWDDVVAFYGKDVRPMYVPEGLTKPDLESGEYVFSRVTEANYSCYDVGDYLRT